MAVVGHIVQAIGSATKSLVKDFLNVKNLLYMEN